MIKRSIVVFCVILSTATYLLHAQGLKELSKNGIVNGSIYLYESYKDTSEMRSKENYFNNSKIKLKNKTTNVFLDIKETVEIDSPNVFVKFHDPIIKSMQNCAFVVFVNDTIYASSDSTSDSFSSNPLAIDLKPSLDLSKAQELDINWDRNLTGSSLGDFAGNVKLHAEGKFSTKPDSAVLNSVIWSVGYRLIWGNAGVFKYFAVTGQVGGEHPQDFSQTNLVGSIVLSSILPWTDILARVVTDNQKDASIGLLIQPAVDFVKDTKVSDSSYVRGAIHSNWEIPLFNNQYADIYSVAYFQNGYRPRSYIEISLVQKLTSSFAIIAKWVNGELPPFFNRVADLRIGFQLQ
jgi:hypothetical protein